MTPPKSKVKPHLFRPGPAGEADANGHRICLDCHLVGQPGDAHHALPDPIDDARQRAAGEREG